MSWNKCPHLVIVAMLFTLAESETETAFNVELHGHRQFHLHRKLEVGDVITAWGVMYNNTATLSMNILAPGGVYLIHVDFRPNRDYMVLNNYIPHRGGWQNGYRVAFSSSNFKIGEVFMVEIRVKPKVYVVYFNGNKIPLNFNRRASIKTADRIGLHKGSEDVHWTALHLPKNKDRLLPFSIKANTLYRPEFELEEGDIITVWGVFANETTRFSVNLRSGNGDTLLRVEFRPPPDENIVVFTSYEGGIWMQGLQAEMPSIKHGKVFKVKIVCGKDKFGVTVNSNPLGSVEYRPGYALKDFDGVELLGGKNGMTWTDLHFYNKDVVRLALTSATQSSVADGSNPENAIDGNTDGKAGSCTQSRGGTGENNFWEGYLAEESTVTEVVMYNTEHNKHYKYLPGATVYVGDVYCGEIYKVDKNHLAYAVKCDNVVGSSVRIVQNYNYLILCEVEVYGKKGESGDGNHKIVERDEDHFFMVTKIQPVLPDVEIFDKGASIRVTIDNRDSLEKVLPVGRNAAIECRVETKNLDIENPEDKSNVKWYRVNPDGEEEELTEATAMNVEKGVYEYKFENPTSADSGIYRCEFRKQAIVEKHRDRIPVDVIFDAEVALEFK